MRAVLATLLAAITAQGQPGGADQAAQVHWAVLLGRRAEAVSRAIPTVDRVVLVPDGATFLDELSRWSPQGRWPVLIEDDHLAPMFIRRFGPAQVIRREPVPAPAKDREKRQARMDATVVSAFGGDPERESIRQVFDRLNYVPPGVVIASAADPAWTAAVALAAGRGQPIAWMDGDFGRPNQSLPGERAAELRAAFDEAVAGAGYPYAELGDAIDAVTLCRSMVGRIDLGPEGQWCALTDVLARTEAGRRYAIAGWIFGDEARSAYAAMCSLFLERTRFWLFNTYADSGGWGAYGVDEAAAILRAPGFEATTASGEAASLRSWLALLPGGVATDVLAMNSKGNADFFDLADGRAASRDVPVLNEPAALHLVHSFSMRGPENPATVGCQWLSRGVYAYVGSVQEPGLSAFVPPKPLAERWAAGIPFLVAARQWEGGPWKLNTFGDPLMTCGPPPAAALKRVSPEVDGGGLDLRAHAAAVMRRASENPGDEPLAEAIATLTLLGEDEIALEMWRPAGQGGHPKAAAAALQPLFRARRMDDYVRAMLESGRRDDQSVTMLWHLAIRKLAGLTDQDTLMLLQSTIRPDQPEVDLARLAPALTAVFGPLHARNVIQRELDKTTDARTRKKLEALLQSPEGAPKGK